MKSKTTLYHGSLAAFDEFEVAEPRFGDAGTLGVYLTDVYSEAALYARPTNRDCGFDDRDDGFVYTVEASYENMKIEAPAASGLSRIEQIQLDCNEDEIASYKAGLIAEGFDCVRFDTLDGYSEYVFFNREALRIVDRTPVAEFKPGAVMAPAVTGMHW